MEACRPWAPRLSAWFDGECSDLDGAEVRGHLLQCPGCRAAASRWGALRADLELLDAPAPDAELVQRMAVRFEHGLAREVHGLARALRLWKLAAALLLAVGVGSLLADRLFLPGPAQASAPRDLDRAIQELFQQPGRPWSPSPVPAQPAAAER